MTTTVVAVFQGQDKADEALAALRETYPGENISILVRSEQQAGMQSRTAECMDSLTRQAINITSTAGDLMIRSVALTANAMLTLPLRMMAPVVHSLTGYADNVSGGCMSGSRSGNMSGGMGSMGNMGNMGSMGSISGQQNMCGSRSERVEVTLQGDGHLLGTVELLKHHGATNVQTYTA